MIDAKPTPAEFALLADGGQVLIRPFAAADLPRVQDLFGRLVAESRQTRFHSAGIRLEGETLAGTVAGHALVAELGGDIVALANYVRLRDPARAEMAIAVDDHQQGRGIGTALFESLSRDARRAGIRRFLAIVMPSNQAMFGLLQNLGFGINRAFASGEVEVDVTLRPDPTYVAAADARRHVAATASLEPLFRARSVAVVGASRRRGSIGHELFRNLLAGGFDGPVYPVNPTATAVASVRAYPTVAAIGAPVDLAIVVVPAAAVLDAAREALDAGARALVVISAGFAEVGEEGRRRQDELLALCRARSVRLVGPNCMGVLVSGPEGTLNATFAPTLPPTGTVAVASQSGALGIAILEHARQLGIGISSFVSMGNKADLSSNDLLEWWEDDASTGAILLYLESFGNGRRFARVARRVAARKPIVAVKGGRGQAGQRAAASHTAALAGSDVAVDALFRQAGVIRCDTLEELFDVTTLLANQPLPAGLRVGVLTNAGGLGILCADACEANGLTLPSLEPETQAALRALLPPEASVTNPVDMLASGAAPTYGQALRLVLADPSVDAAIVLFIPPLVTEADDVAAALTEACDPPPPKPVLACFVGAQGTPSALRGVRAIPSFTFPEAAARALGHAADYATWLRRPAGEVPEFADIDGEAARPVVSAAFQREERPWLTPDEVAALLRAYRIPTAAVVIARSPPEAAAAFAELGGPVAVKLVSGTILHKSDVGGVHLDLRTPEAAADAYRAIARSLEERGLSEAMGGALVQPMLSGGVECLVGVVTDPTFGPLIGFGLGGVLAELLGDVAFRVHPLTDIDADELISGGKAHRLLAGYRGAPPADLPALRELLLRLSRLVEDVPEIAELDINPVIVRPAGQGALALDARIRLARPG
ncbi:MAG: GNAT family N-acetyltransferase [Chloroflexota bacterium]|nr:MAG: GNAT family N-acetyltransferase [Chloroflexota bacterium]